MTLAFTFPFDAGPFAWILVPMAFIAVVFVIERAMFLHRGLVLSSDFIEGVRNNLRAGGRSRRSRHAKSPPDRSPAS